MKKEFLVVLIISFFLFSCQTTDEKYSKIIIGDWESIYYIDGITFIDNTSYFPNNKFESHIIMANKGYEQELMTSGKWEIKEGYLCYTAEASNFTELIPIGISSCGKIKEIADSKCKIESKGKIEDMYKLPLEINEENLEEIIIHLAKKLVKEEIDFNFKLTGDIIKGDFNNDANVDYATVIENPDNEKSICIIHGKTNEFFSYSCREGISLIPKKEMEIGFGNDIGDGIMDMCDGCVPSIWHWNGKKYETSGYFW